MSAVLLLYELGQRVPRAHVDEHGQVWARGEGCAPDVLVDERRMARGGLLPRILFADVPVPLHLIAGVMLAPIAEADADTGPEGLYAQREDERMTAWRASRATTAAASETCVCGGTMWEDAEAGGRCINCGVAHPNMAADEASDDIPTTTPCDAPAVDPESLIAGLHAEIALLAAQALRDVTGAAGVSRDGSRPVLVACAACGEELHPDEASKGSDGRPLCSGCALEALAAELAADDPNRR